MYDDGRNPCLGCEPPNRLAPWGISHFWVDMGRGVNPGFEAALLYAKRIILLTNVSFRFTMLLSMHGDYDDNDKSFARNDE